MRFLIPQKHPGIYWAFLLLLLLGTGRLSAEVKITGIRYGGQPHPLQLSSRDESSQPALVQIGGNSSEIKFEFTEIKPQGVFNGRLRYKLEGQDETWMEPKLSIYMRVMLRFEDALGNTLDVISFGISGESDGWTGSITNSPYVARREVARAPARAASARVVILSGGSEQALGIAAFDAIRVQIESAGGEEAAEYDLSITKGSDLKNPMGSPENWVKEGSAAGMAVLGTRDTPQPHPVLVLQDDNPNRFCGWRTHYNQIRVQPGDRVTLSWESAHSVGAAGPGGVSYQNLQPGRYWFQVAAAELNGKVTAERATLQIEVLAPFFKRGGFWLAILVFLNALVVAIGYGLRQRKARKQMARLERQQALERERSRIARDLHDDIGAGLTEIAMKAAMVRRDLEEGPTKETLRGANRICQSSIELIRSIDEIVWSLNPANDTLERFVYYLTHSIEQFLSGSCLRVRFDIQPNLPEHELSGKMRHYLFLSVREALNNVVKHSGANLLKVELRVDLQYLHIAIEDNGCGIGNQEAASEGTCEGLASMQSRLTELGGEFRLEKLAGAGTRIELGVALKERQAPSPSRGETRRGFLFDFYESTSQSRDEQTKNDSRGDC